MVCIKGRKRAVPWEYSSYIPLSTGLKKKNTTKDLKNLASILDFMVNNNLIILPDHRTVQVVSPLTVHFTIVAQIAGYHL